MIFESEFQNLAILNFILTASAWLYGHGLPESYTSATHRANATDTNTAGKLKQAAKPAFVLLPVTRPTPPAIATNMPLDQSDTKRDDQRQANRLTATAQLDRISQILAASQDVADNAQRLHMEAHEQIDSAQYALQNLLAELSAVMPVATPPSNVAKPRWLAAALPPASARNSALAA